MVLVYVLVNFDVVLGMVLLFAFIYVWLGSVGGFYMLINMLVIGMIFFNLVLVLVNEWWIKFVFMVIFRL